MKIDFNHVRKQAVYAHNRLVKKLNMHIEDEQVVIDVNLIERELEALRNWLVRIACSYIEGNPDCAMLGDELEFDVFNPENEEE